MMSVQDQRQPIQGGILAIPPLRSLFNLQALDLVAYLMIGGAALLWAILMWVIWRFHLFERFFQLADQEFLHD